MSGRSPRDCWSRTKEFEAEKVLGRCFEHLNLHRKSIAYYSPQAPIKGIGLSYVESSLKHRQAGD